MDKLGFYSVSDEYIDFLKTDPHLSNVAEHKSQIRLHTRKYWGVVIQQHGLKYYIPLSTPKKSDYITLEDGSKRIRNSIIPIIRITYLNPITNKLELKGTLKISNMIPVPDSELTPYSIDDNSTDQRYKDLLHKEYDFIKSNRSMIIKNAQQLYTQKNRRDELFADTAAPKYLDSTVDFLYAEQKCKEFIKMREKTKEPVTRRSVKDRLKEAQNLVEKSENHIKTRDDKLR